MLDAYGAAPATGPVALRFSIQPYSGHQFNNVLAGVRGKFSDDMGLQLRIKMDDQMQGMMNDDGARDGDRQRHQRRLRRHGLDDGREYHDDDDRRAIAPAP